MPNWTSEHCIRGTYCDLAVRVDDKLIQLIEVKAAVRELPQATKRVDLQSMAALRSHAVRALAGVTVNADRSARWTRVTSERPETSAWGIRALQGYLRFAKDGILSVPTATGRQPDSDFEVAVIEAVSRYEAEPQVGVAGYFYWTSGCRPEVPWESGAGVECDGATYHSSKAARDRDRLRQEILERLRWRIHRIWSLDCIAITRETDRLLSSLQGAVAMAE